MHFITIGVGTITGGIAGGFLTEFHYKRLTRRNGGIARPEFKLFSLLYMTWLGPIGLFGYFFITYWGVVSGRRGGVCANPSHTSLHRQHWIFADVSIVIFCFGISAAVVSLQSYIVDCFSLLAGSALTSTIVVRSFFGFGATVVSVRVEREEGDMSLSPSAHAGGRGPPPPRWPVLVWCVSLDAVHRHLRSRRLHRILSRRSDAKQEQVRHAQAVIRLYSSHPALPHLPMPSPLDGASSL